MKAFSTLFRVEFRLSLRDMNMPIFAVIMPVVVMLVVGMMFGDQPAYEGASYTFVAQSVGAVSAVGICAALPWLNSALALSCAFFASSSPCTSFVSS